MVYINNIPYFKVYKQKVYIQRENNKIGYGCVAILNNKSIDDSLKIFDHPHIEVNNSKYFSFYIDRLYREKIHTKQYRLNNKQYQEDAYEKIKEKNKLMKTPLKISTINGKNFFYDLSIYNELFFKSTSSLNIKKKIEMYFNYINNIINNKTIGSEYVKTMYINVESWFTTKDDINNPIMYIFIAAKRFPELLEKLGDIDIVIYDKNYCLKINPKMIEKENFNLFRIELNKLTKRVAISDDTALNEIIEKEIIKVKVKAPIVEPEKADEKQIEVKNKDEKDNTEEVQDKDGKKQEKEEITPVVTDLPITVDNDEFNNKMNEKIESELNKIYNTEDEIDLSSDEIAERIKTELNHDKELVDMMHTLIQEKKTGKSTASIKRDEELRKKQKMIKIENKTLDEYVSEKTEDFTIESFEIDNKVVTTNENVKEVRFTNFEKSYNEKLFRSDTIKIFENLNTKSIPTYIVDMDIEDSSDELNYKDTYHVVLEDENRVRHSLTFDVPKFIDDKFLYLNGNKKIITKQLFMKPIVKTAPDTVQVCSNYNKIFIRRYGPKVSPKLEKFKRVITVPVTGLLVKNGDSRSINARYKTILEYDSISENILSLKTKDFTLYFNQDEITSRLGSYKLGEDDFCIGFYNNNKPVIVSYKTEKIKDTDMDIIDFIVANSPNTFKTNFDETKITTNKYTYSRATIMSKDLPILLLLGYCEGITEVLRKGNIKHYFTDTRPTVSDNEAVVKFADCYLVYDRYPYSNSLLLNAFSILPTSSLDYEEFNEKDVYVEIFYELFKARNLANAFDSFYEFMIDPITKEVLEDLDYPTDFVSVILFANELLADNSYITENNMNLYRVRSNEVVNAIIHKKIADAYSAYRVSAGNTNPSKISIPKDAVIKELLKLNTLEEFSTLNPMYESDKLRAITPKGLNGMNMERAFTQDKRSYDKTMLGVLAVSSSPDANVGVVRKLTMEPNITGPRGYINTGDNNKKDINIFSAAEMLTPMGVTHDDSIRTAMASKQSGHVIPVAKSSPVLISNGIDQTIQYSLSKDFIITAEDDGEVVEKDEDTGIVIVKYKNGKSQAVDTKPRVLKNSSSGFYISNKLNCDLNVGDKVKKKDIIGYEDKFFSNDGHNKNRFNIGSLQKIAIMSSYSTFEDSTFVTKKMSEAMASDIVMMSDVIIGKNSNVGKMVKIGDTVEVGDILVEFDTSFEEEGLNKFLANISDELKDDIKSLGKVPIKSKYSGIVQDIKIYSSVELDELSPSLKKVVSGYYNSINKKKKLLEKYDDSKGIIKAGILFNEPTSKIKPSADGKIKGKEVFDGVLIEFYIKYFDPITVGDKITFYSALKAIVGEVVEEGLEPFSEFRPDEEISAFLGPSAVLARMVPSVMLVMFGNKVLIELKNKLKDIYLN